MLRNFCCSSAPQWSNYRNVASSPRGEPEGPLFFFFLIVVVVLFCFGVLGAHILPLCPVPNSRGFPHWSQRNLLGY